MLKKNITLLLSVFAFSNLAIASTVTEAERTAIENRIKPVGGVTTQNTPSQETTQVEKTPRDGKAVYSMYCTACHATGISNAPITHDKNSWASHLEKGQQALLNNAKNGINTMPPMGSCMDCSDEELQAAIDYMIK